MISGQPGFFPSLVYEAYSDLHQSGTKITLNTDELYTNWIPHSASVILPLTGGTNPAFQVLTSVI